MERGDHLVSPRTGYSHHGIYLGNHQVIHYSGYSSGQQSGVIAITDLDTFCQGHECIIQEHVFRIYDTETSIRRACGRLGEDWYDVLLNNCEHFVTWCIQGFHESSQVNNLIATAVIARKILAAPAETLTVQALGNLAGRGSAEGEVVRRLAQAAASSVANSTASTTVGTAAGTTAGTAAGIASGNGISTAGIASAFASGFAAPTALPVLASVATGLAVGYGVKKLLEWMTD